MDERRNVTRLIRFVCLFVAVPTFTIGIALYAYAPDEHAFHMVAFLILAAAAAVVAWKAPGIAARFVPE